MFVVMVCLVYRIGTVVVGTMVEVVHECSSRVTLELYRESVG